MQSHNHYYITTHKITMQVLPKKSFVAVLKLNIQVTDKNSLVFIYAAELL